MSQKLKDMIAETIWLPKWISQHTSSESQDIIWSILNIIYTDCVTGVIISDRKATWTVKKLEKEFDVLQENLPAADYFLVWDWIGTTVLKWLKSSIELEEFETASNLQKVMGFDNE